MPDNEPLEIWERRMEEIVDRKLKPIEKRLQRLAEAHDAKVSQHEQGLLDLYQSVSAILINDAITSFSSIIQSQLSGDSTLHTQLFADAAVAKSQALSSETPLKIVVQFKRTWKDKLVKLGASGISI